MYAVHASERTPFVGRARERGLLLAEVTAGTRLLTLIGPSGIGKTRLVRDALRVAYPHPALFCSLVGCSTASDLQAAVARALGVTVRAGDQLERILAERGPLLLALDNLDDLDAEAAALVAEWLARAPELQFLGTSIVPLRIEEEACFEVGPLDPADAVALYLERAHRAWADRAFTDADRQAIEELVRRLDRIPLAIELAAARVRVLPPQAMLPRLGQRFELLESQRKGRHGSLLRALQVTWDLLSPAEQETLARASVFEGSFTLEAAEAVIGAGAGDLLDRLDGLRAKALLQIDGDAEPRFSLYESVRAFAALQLQDADAIAQRHAAFFIEAGSRHAARVDGPEAPAAIRWLKAERENLTAILRRRGESRPLDAVRAGLALSPILALDGPPASEAELLDATMRAARAAGDPELLVRALRSRAFAILQHGRTDEALADIEEGLALARPLELRRQEGALLIDAGHVHLRRGALDRALEHIEKATAIGVELGDTEIEALAWLYRGSVERSLHSTERAFESFERSHTLLRRHGHLRREAIALLNIAVMHSAGGRFAEAVQALDEVIEIGRRLESRVFEADAIVNRGGVHLAAGDLDAAEADSRLALELQRALGNKRFEALALANLGIALLERDEPAAAEREMAGAMSILRASGERRLLAALFPYLAVAAARQGRHEAADRVFAELKELQAETRDAQRHVMTDLVEGCLELARAAEDRERSVAAERARERLARATALAGSTEDCVFTGIRLLRQDLARIERSAAGAGALEVGPGGAWFRAAGGERVDLRRRASLRRMLDGLVERRLAAPGSCLETGDLFRLGWPDEHIKPEAEIARVYTGVWTLRTLGLAEAILRQSEGYLLDPQLPVSRAEE